MKVLFIAGSDFTIHPNHRAHHFVSFLEKQGVQVDIISLKRFYSGSSELRPWQRFWRGLHEGNGKRVEVIRKDSGSQLLIRRLPGRFDYVAQDLWAIFNLQALENQKYEICVFGNPDNVFLPWFLKKKGVIETIIYDDWDYYYGFNNSFLIKLLIKWRESFCISISDTVISVGALLAGLRKFQGAKRTLVIPNGVNYPLFAKAQKKEIHPPTIVYMGKLAEEYGVDVSITGFAEVCKVIPTVRYFIIGYNEDTYSRYLRSLVNGLGLNDHVQFLGKKPYEELPDYLSQADIGVALFKPNDLMKYSFPLKVVEYLAAGLAVIGINIGETGKMIAESNSGEALEYSSKEFSESVINLLNDKSRLAEYSKNAAEYAKHYDWDILFSDLFDELQKVNRK